MAVVFVTLFQDYIKLCQQNNWPNNETSLEEIRNSFLISQHIEKCLDKLQKKCLMDEFLSNLNKTHNASSLFFKQCFSDPPKYILKKIINSSSKIDLMDVALSIFVELFTVKKLEVCLSDFILEAASKETLLENLVYQFPKEILLEFKSMLFLSEISNTANPKKFVNGMLKNVTKETLEVLLLSILNKDIKYHREVEIVLEALQLFMSIRNDRVVSRKFWKLYFEMEEEILLKVCLNHADVFKHMSNLLIECGQLIRDNMSVDYFYVNLTFLELVSIVKMICKDVNLKLEFFDVVHETNQDLLFWENML